MCRETATRILGKKGTCDDCAIKTPSNTSQTNFVYIFRLYLKVQVGIVTREI